MKKIKTLLLLVSLCAIIFSFACQNLVLATEKTNTVSLLDLVRLKKYLVGITVEGGEFDYNNDNKIDSKDLVSLINRILNPQDSDSSNQGESEVDDDGYYNQVVKP